MNLRRSNHALNLFHRKEWLLIGQIERHQREKRTKKKPCTKENPCWDCPRCVPGRYT